MSLPLNVTFNTKFIVYWNISQNCLNTLKRQIFTFILLLKWLFIKCNKMWEINIFLEIIIIQQLPKIWILFWKLAKNLQNLISRKEDFRRSMTTRLITPYDPYWLFMTTHSLSIYKTFCSSRYNWCSQDHKSFTAIKK